MTDALEAIKGYAKWQGNLKGEVHYNEGLHEALVLAGLEIMRLRAALADKESKAGDE